MLPGSIPLTDTVGVTVDVVSIVTGDELEVTVPIPGAEGGAAIVVVIAGGTNLLPEESVPARLDPFVESVPEEAKIVASPLLFVSRLTVDVW